MAKNVWMPIKIGPERKFPQCWVHGASHFVQVHFFFAEVVSDFSVLELATLICPRYCRKVRFDLWLIFSDSPYMWFRETCGDLLGNWISHHVFNNLIFFSLSADAFFDLMRSPWSAGLVETCFPVILTCVAAFQNLIRLVIHAVTLITYVIRWVFPVPARSCFTCLPCCQYCVGVCRELISFFLFSI